MARKSRKNEVVPATEPVADHEQVRLQRWTRTTQRKGGEPTALAQVSRGLKHGIFAFRIIGEEEQLLFSELIEAFRKEFVLNQSVDFIQLELACIYGLQLFRAIAAQNWEAAERVDRLMRHHLSDLKSTKRVREGEGAVGEQISPAEWATELLERVRQARARGIVVEAPVGEVIDAEVSETPEKTPKALPRIPDEDSEEHA